MARPESTPESGGALRWVESRADATLRRNWPLESWTRLPANEAVLVTDVVAIAVNDDLGNADSSLTITECCGTVTNVP